MSPNPDGNTEPIRAQAIDEIDEMESDAEDVATPPLEFALERSSNNSC